MLWLINIFLQSGMAAGGQHQKLDPSFHANLLSFESVNVHMIVIISMICFSLLLISQQSGMVAGDRSHLQFGASLQANRRARKKSKHKPDKERAKLAATDNKHEVKPLSVSAEKFNAQVSELAECFFKNLDRKQKAIFLSTLRSLLTLVFSLDGGAGFVCAPSETYDYLKEMDVDMAVVDSSKKFPDGYMTESLSEQHIESRQHQKRVRAFAQHTRTDRWPKGHEAAGLPKDGYMLYGSSGFCRRAAAGLVGLPPPGCKWAGKGMRHTTALQLCWALRGHTALVVVRSDSGMVHVLCPGEKTVKVWAVIR